MTGIGDALIVLMMNRFGFVCQTASRRLPRSQVQETDHVTDLKIALASAWQPAGNTNNTQPGASVDRRIAKHTRITERPRHYPAAGNTGSTEKACEQRGRRSGNLNTVGTACTGID